MTNTPRRLLDAAAKVLPHVRPGRKGSTAPNPQTLTVDRTPGEVLSALQDPTVLSRLLGDLGQVTSPGPGEFTWTLGEDALHVPTRLAVQRDALDFLRAEPAEPAVEVDDDTEGGVPAPPAALVSVRTRPAPLGLGTEVTLLVDVPTGAVAFTVLYRLRALLQTGEIPTISPQPAAREGDR